MRAENLHTNYHTTAAYEKLYDGYYDAMCNHCGKVIARSTNCQMGEEGRAEALANAIGVCHSCPEKAPLVVR